MRCLSKNLCLFMAKFLKNQSNPKTRRQLCGLLDAQSNPRDRATYRDRALGIILTNNASQALAHAMLDALVLDLRATGTFEQPVTFEQAAEAAFGALEAIIKADKIQLSFELRAIKLEETQPGTPARVPAGVQGSSPKKRPPTEAKMKRHVTGAIPQTESPLRPYSTTHNAVVTRSVQKAKAIGNEGGNAEGGEGPRAATPQAASTTFGATLAAGGRAGLLNFMSNDAGDGGDDGGGGGDGGSFVPDTYPESQKSQVDLFKEIESEITSCISEFLDTQTNEVLAVDVTKKTIKTALRKSFGDSWNDVWAEHAEYIRTEIARLHAAEMQKRGLHSQAASPAPAAEDAAQDDALSPAALLREEDESDVDQGAAKDKTGTGWYCVNCQNLGISFLLKVPIMQFGRDCDTCGIVKPAFLDRPEAEYRGKTSMVELTEQGKPRSVYDDRWGPRYGFGCNVNPCRRRKCNSCYPPKNSDSESDADDGDIGVEGMASGSGKKSAKLAEAEGQLAEKEAMLAAAKKRKSDKANNDPGPSRSAKALKRAKSPSAPPAKLELTGAPEGLACNGIYHLSRLKTMRGRVVFENKPLDRYIAIVNEQGHWGVQDLQDFMDELDTVYLSLHVNGQECYPHESTEPWQGYNKGWIPLPDVKCTLGEAAVGGRAT